MTNSTVETTPKRSLDELIYYFQAKETILKGSFSRLNSRVNHEGFIDFTFTVSDIEKEVQIVNETIERLEQAKDDEAFYRDFFEMFHSMGEREKRKSLQLLKRVMELSK